MARAKRDKRAFNDVTARFADRIIGHGRVPASSFLANPDNWRIHPVSQQEVMTGLLERIGFVSSVIVNKRTHPGWGESRGVETMVDGHLRVSVALSRGEETEVPVDYVDLSPEEEAAVLVSFDPVSAMATTDREKLDALVQQMPDELVELTAVLRAERRAVKPVSFEAMSSWRVIVECDNEGQRDSLLARLQQDGYSCRTE